MRARARTPAADGGPAVQSRSVLVKRSGGAWNRSSPQEPEKRLVEVPGEELLVELGPFAGDPVDPRAVDGRHELGQLEREGVVG